MNSNYKDNLHKLLSIAEGHSIRVECTVASYDLHEDVWREALKQVYEVVRERPFHFVEVANEPGKGDKGNPIEIARDVNTFGVISAYGIEPRERDGWIPLKDMLDYGTIHLARDMEHFPRNSKDILEHREYTGIPWIDDEPLGIAEFDFPGRRTTNRMAVASHFGIAALFGGATVHSESGLYSFFPTETEQRLTGDIASIWKFIPNHFMTGQYSAPHLDNWILSNPMIDYPMEHAYAMIIGSDAYLVIPTSTNFPTPIPITPWHVEAQLKDFPIWKLVR